MGPRAMERMHVPSVNLCGKGGVAGGRGAPARIYSRKQERKDKDGEGHLRHIPRMTDRGGCQGKHIRAASGEGAPMGTLYR